MTVSDDQRELYRAANEWNARNDVGTPVLAWPGTRDQDPLRTRTRTGAWVLPAGQVVVSVDGYAGGIDLSHIQLDPIRQPALPDVEFPMPPCPICSEDLDSDGDALTCSTCEASWSTNGTKGTWDAPDAMRCPATRYAYPTVDPDVIEQCVLAFDHDPGTHRPADGIGEWTDDDKDAVLDSDGDAIADGEAHA